MYAAESGDPERFLLGHTLAFRWELLAHSPTTAQACAQSLHEVLLSRTSKEHCSLIKSVHKDAYRRFCHRQASVDKQQVYKRGNLRSLGILQVDWAPVHPTVSSSFSTSFQAVICLISLKMETLLEPGWLLARSSNVNLVKAVPSCVKRTMV